MLDKFQHKNPNFAKKKFKKSSRGEKGTSQNQVFIFPRDQRSKKHENNEREKKNKPSCQLSITIEKVSSNNSRLFEKIEEIITKKKG